MTTRQAHGRCAVHDSTSADSFPVGPTAPEGSVVFADRLPANLAGVPLLVTERDGRAIGVIGPAAGAVALDFVTKNRMGLAAAMKGLLDRAVGSPTRAAGAPRASAERHAVAVGGPEPTGGATAFGLAIGRAVAGAAMKRIFGGSMLDVPMITTTETFGLGAVLVEAASSAHTATTIVAAFPVIAGW